MTSPNRNSSLRNEVSPQRGVVLSLGWRFKFAGAAATLWWAATGHCAEPAATANTLASTNAPAVVSQPLRPEEIKRALARMHSVTNCRAAGTWRLSVINDYPAASYTNITYEWRRPDGQIFIRKEIDEREKNTKRARPSFHHYHLKNEQGYWAVCKDIAILYPDPTGGFSAAAVGLKSASPPDLAELDPEEPPPSSATAVTLNPDDPSMVIFTGERLTRNGRTQLLIVAQCGEASHRKLEKDFKRKLPLFIRPLLSDSALKQMLEEVIPVRIESLLDEKTGTLILRRQFSKDGHLLLERREWESWDDLPTNAYVLPRNVKRANPRTDDKARRLESQAREEEKQSVK